MIGGGFDKGVHNVSEAAVYGVPTIFGANYHKFEEINELVDLQLAFPVIDYDNFEKKLIELIENKELRHKISSSLFTYFDKQTTTSSSIINAIIK